MNIASPVPSLLTPEPQPLAWAVVGAIALHGAILGAFGAFNLATHDPPKLLIDPDHALEVSMVMLPKAERMPQKAEQAPRPQGTPEPPPTPTPAVAPPPNPSDLAYREPDTPPEQAEGTPDRSTDRAALIRKMMMEQAIQNAAEGTVDREATDPDSESTETVQGSASGINNDPELARYIAKLRALFMGNFRPLPTITASNPDIRADVLVQIDASGAVIGREISASSGNASYDAAALRAVDAVSQIPLPPEKYKDRARQGYTIRFTAPN